MSATFDCLGSDCWSWIQRIALSGKHVFKLYDTFGFPVDLIEDILRDSDYSLDLKGYEEEMIKQKKS